MNDTTQGRPLLLGKSIILPQEERIDLSQGARPVRVGVPRERLGGESRVCIAPHAAELLAGKGNPLVVERGAGAGASFRDDEYAEAGAQIAETPGEVFGADVVVKVQPPTLAEVALLRPGQVLVSALQSCGHSREMIEALQARRVTAVAFEYLRDAAGRLCPVAESMSEIAGSASILIAAEYLSNASGGKGEMLGGIPGVSPTCVVVLGATAAGESAARTALGLGAQVMLLDASIDRLRQLEYRLGQRLWTSVAQPRAVQKALRGADVVIGSLPFDDGALLMVDQATVAAMKPGSVIVDLCMESGGCFETSEPTTLDRPTFRRHGVVHYCAPNIPARVARTASYALSNILGPMLCQFADAGGLRHMLAQDPGFRAGVYLLDGILTKPAIGRRLGIASRDIDLLLAAY